MRQNVHGPRDGNPDNAVRAIGPAVAVCFDIFGSLESREIRARMHRKARRRMRNFWCFGCTPDESPRKKHRYKKRHSDNEQKYSGRDRRQQSGIRVRALKIHVEM